MDKTELAGLTHPEKIRKRKELLEAKRNGDSSNDVMLQLLILNELLGYDDADLENENSSVSSMDTNEDYSDSGSSGSSDSGSSGGGD